MARVIFRVPDGIKDEFEREFNGQNLNIIIALLMHAAVTAAQRRRREEILRGLTQRHNARRVVQAACGP